MKKWTLPIIGLALFLFIALISFSNSVQAAPGYSPLLDAPTPTVVNYWAGSSETFDIDFSAGLDQCLDEGWYIEEVYGGGCPDFAAPADNYPAAILITLNSVTYTGDTNLQAGSNTNWFQKFNDYWTSGADEMTVGVTTCNGTSDGCEAAGYVVDTNHDWEGYATYGGVNYINGPHVYAQLGGSTNGVNFSLQPIFYGVVGEDADLLCSLLTPDNVDEVQTGTLLGTDEVGHIIELVIGEDYLLYTEDGPWNDGTDNRYDVAIRFFDGTEWSEFEPLADWTDEDADTDDPCDDSFLDSEDNEAVGFTATTETQSINLRVNDIDAAFDDNSLSINYVISTAAPGYGQGCSAYWEKGDAIGALTIDATDSNYQSWPSTARVSSGIYGLVIEGTYVDNGADSNDVEVATYPETYYYHHNYADINVWSGVNTCYNEDDTYKEYYGHARSTFYDYDDTYNFGYVVPLGRADDSNWADNSGTIDATLYEVTYNAPPSDCGTTFDKGTYLETISIDSQSSNGIQFPRTLPRLPENQYFYLEPSSSYSLNGTESYAFEIKPNAIGLGDWEDDDYYAECVTQVDHERYGYYFKTDENLLPSLTGLTSDDFMWLRADSSGFPAVHSNNTGTLQVDLYMAVSNVVPDDEDCSDYYDADTLVYRDSIDADVTAGYSLDHSVFTPDQIYKIVTTDATNALGEIRRAYSGQSPTPSFEDFEDWGAGLCYEQESGQDAVYFTAEAFSDYEIRTDGADTATGTFSFDVYTTDTLKNPAFGCEYRDYGDVDQWYIVREDAAVMANQGGVGDEITNAFLLANELWEGYNYKIETSNGPWTSSGVPPSGYGLQISEDGGQTWQDLEDWLDCVVEVNDHIRGFKSDVTAAGPFLLRVNDPEELWVNNNGYITVDFYTDFDGDVNDGDFDPWGAWGFGSGCTADCQRPGSWLEVGGWIEYGRCAIVKYFSWCQAQQQEIDRMKTKYYGVEPFTTIMEFVDLGSAVRDEVDSYSWGDDVENGGGEPTQVNAPLNYLFGQEGGGADIPIVGEDTVWGGGEITLTGPDGLSYETECDSLLADSLGTGLSRSVCFFFNVTDALGINTWFQLLWDLAMVAGLGLYINNSWIKKALT